MGVLMKVETRGLRALPPALLFAFGLDIVHRGWSSLAKLEDWRAEPVFLAWVGVRIAMLALAVYGTYDLATSLVGRARRGVQVATIAYLAAATETVAFAMYLGLTHRAPHWTFTLEWWVSFALARAIVIGFAVAAWNRVALAIIALELLLYWPSPLFEYLVSGSDRADTIWWEAVRSILHVVALVVLAVTPARRSQFADAARAVAGLRGSARALWIRVGSSVGAGSMLLLAIAQSDQRTAGGIALAFVAAAAVGVVASALFARGLLDVARAEVPELPRWPFVMAAAATLWCAGVTLHQLPALYSFLFRGDEDRAATIRALPVATALALLAALAITAISISTFARRRGDDALRAYAVSRGLSGVLLVCGSIAVIAAVEPDAAAIGGLISMWGFALLARLCTRAALSLERGAAIPSARVVNP
jgi:hypothetical protein